MTAYIRFLVDTGADFTLIHPEAMATLGISPRKHFAGSNTDQSQGIGGTAKLYIEPCDLFLPHDNGTWDQLAITIRFAVKNKVNQHYPSLLGRDVLNYYRFTFEQGADLVSLETP